MMKPHCYSEYSIQGPSILVASSWVWSLREVVHPNLHLIGNLKNTQILQGAQWIRRKGMFDLKKKHTFFSVLITGLRFSGFLFLLNLIMLIVLWRSYLDWYKLIEPRFNQGYLGCFKQPALETKPPPCTFPSGHKKRATIEFQNNKAVPVEWVRHLRNGSTTDREWMMASWMMAPRKGANVNGEFHQTVGFLG